MRRVRLETVGDIEALPKGEWVHAPGGFQADWEDPDFTLKEGGFEILLPARVAKLLRLRHGSKFQATARGKRLVLRK